MHVRGFSPSGEIVGFFKATCGGTKHLNCDRAHTVVKMTSPPPVDVIPGTVGPSKGINPAGDPVAYMDAANRRMASCARGEPYDD